MVIRIGYCNYWYDYTVQTFIKCTTPKFSHPSNTKLLSNGPKLPLRIAILMITFLSTCCCSVQTALLLLPKFIIHNLLWVCSEKTRTLQLLCTKIAFNYRILFLLEPPFLFHPQIQKIHIYYLIENVLVMPRNTHQITLVSCLRFQFPTLLLFEFCNSLSFLFHFRKLEIFPYLFIQTNNRIFISSIF